MECKTKAIADKAYEQSKCSNLGTPIYGKILWLRNCVEQRIATGKPVTKEHLANCSTMKQITLGIVRDLEKRGFPVEKGTVKMTRQKIGEELAANILNL